ncbi:MAG: RnfABCDGE type electron transport complex subunit B, partial [Rhodanobacteraceae bacterium]
RCPPGGAAGIRELADLLDRKVLALDPACGVEKPRAVALIDESACIGCTKCIQACPVDAIIGSARRMHTVLADECTGCELCLEPCPVDCIAMLPVAVNEADPDRAAARARAEHARQRFQARNSRLERMRRERAARTWAGYPSNAQRSPIGKTAVLAAIERGRAKRRSVGSSRQRPPST